MKRILTALLALCLLLALCACETLEPTVTDENTPAVHQSDEAKEDKQDEEEQAQTPQEESIQPPEEEPLTEDAAEEEQPEDDEDTPTEEGFSVSILKDGEEERLTLYTVTLPFDCSIGCPENYRSDGEGLFTSPVGASLRIEETEPGRDLAALWETDEVQLEETVIGVEDYAAKAYQTMDGEDAVVERYCVEQGGRRWILTLNYTVEQEEGLRPELYAMLQTFRLG